jgi:4-hydroxybenzoyl-CoA reductase subunit alpha
MEFGDVEAGFAEADRVFEDTFFYEGNTHLPMEQHATVALPRTTAGSPSGPPPRRRTTSTAR